MSILTQALLAVAIASSLTPALAADLPTHKDALPAPAPAPAPASPWGGFYLGGYAGGAFAGSQQSLSMTDPTIAALLPNLIPQLQNDASQSLGARGAEVGLQAGYDWSLQPGFIAGVVGDFGWSGLSGQRTTNNFLVPALAPLNPYILTQKLSSDWDGSLRLRVGATPLDNLLVYATGGLALREFHYRTTFWDRLDNPPFPVPANETEDVTFAAMRAGWTLGAGAEWRLNRNWSITGEYRHSEFGSVTGQDTLQLVEPTSTGYISHSSGAIHIDTLHIGLNYRFD